MNYEQLMKKARATNDKRDKDERSAGFAPDIDCHPFMRLRTVMAAIECGITTDDWSSIAEAQDILQQAYEDICIATNRKW